VLSALSAAAILFTAGAARSEDFHVESKVFKLGDKKPMIETTTLFVKDIVYDFLKDPQGQKDPEVTILDPHGRRFIVLDPQRKLCTEVSLDDVKEFAKKLRLEAAGHPDPLLNFLSNPNFTEKTDGGQLEFTSPWMVYRLKTVPAKSAGIARQYAEFSFWHSQLNIMINPGSLPPFGRIAVSEKLEERTLLPVEVFMKVSPKGPAQELSLRAEHRFQWTLLESDRKQIDDAQKQFKVFRQVTLQDYNARRAEEIGQNPKAGAKK
jgi:hypothetical protein